MSTQTIWRTAGSTSQTCDVNLVQNAGNSAPGDPFATAAFGSSGLTCYYNTQLIAPTAITLVVQTNTGGWTSGGFILRDATHTPGLYRFDIPNACLATKGETSIVFNGLAGMQTHTIKIIVTAVDMYDSVHAGLTCLPNVASGAAGSLPTTGVGANQINVNAGAADSNIVASGGYTYATGLAQAGGGSSITASAGTTQLQCLAGDKILITAGTGAGQAAYAAGDIDPTTKIIPIVGSWRFLTPDTSSKYQIIKAPGGVPATIDDFWDDAQSTNKHLNSAINITSTAGTIPLNVGGNVVTDAAVLIGTPVLASVSLDIAAIETKLGAPAGASVSADILVANTGIATLTTNYTASRAAKLDNIDVAVSTRLAPTAAGRTLGINATGQAGIDWANISGATTAVALTNTSVKTATDLAALIGTPVTSVSADIAAVETGVVLLNTNYTAARAVKLDNLTNLDATVSSRLAPAVAGRTLGINTTGQAGIDWANIAAPTTAVAFTNTSIKTATDLATLIGTPVTSVSADIAAVKVDTGNVATRLTTTRAGYLDNLSGGAVALQSSIGAIATAVATLPADPASQSVILSATTAINTKLGSPANGSIAADISVVEGHAAAIDSKTTNLPAAPASEGNVTAQGTSVLNRLGTPISSTISADIHNILAAAQTEAYAANGAAPTVPQMLFMIMQQGSNFSINGTAKRVNRLDGVTQAAVFTLNDATNPTAIQRSA